MKAAAVVVTFVAVVMSSACLALHLEVNGSNTSPCTLAEDCIQAVRLPSPQGNFSTGYSFPPNYANSICGYLSTTRACLPQNTECPNLQSHIATYDRVYQYYCSGPGFAEMNAILECSNSKKVQLQTYGIYQVIEGYVDGVGDIIFDRINNDTGIWTRELTIYLICSVVGRAADRLYFTFYSNCGPEAQLAIKHFVTMNYDLLFTSLYDAPSTTCPEETYFGDTSYTSSQSGKRAADTFESFL